MASEPKKDAAASPSGEQVPVSYAEKAMSSLLRLHDELVEEKERRIDLYRRLMDREQQLAEVRAYVQLLENEIGRLGDASNAAALPARSTQIPALPGVATSPGAEVATAHELAAEAAQVEEPADAHAATDASARAHDPAHGRARAEALDPVHAMAHQAALLTANEAVEALEIDEGEPVADVHVAGPAPVVAWVPSNSGRGGRR